MMTLKLLLLLGLAAVVGYLFHVKVVRKIIMAIDEWNEAKKSVH